MAPASHVTRKCSLCGRKLSIKLSKDRTYSGGHFFGRINMNRKSTDWYDSKGRLVEARKKGQKPRLVEYWECDSCYRS